MKIMIIGQLFNKSTLYGYRMLDLDAKQVGDYTLSNIKKVLSTKQTADIIQNAKLINGKITGTNGQLSRYPEIDISTGLLRGNKSPLIVINKIDNVGYTVCDFKGQIQRVKNSEVVNYAKTYGIANGKVVIQDDIEYISSISDAYEQIKLSPSKTGKAGRVNIGIPITTDSSSIAKHAGNEINTELQYNDVFSAMTPEQRSVLKNYYTWYTVDVYTSLAKNVRLNLAPGKAEKLAQLRGIEKWKFAGVNDSYLEGRFNAKCELGHKLRYEYYAIPEEDAKDVNAKTMDWHRFAFRMTRGKSDDLVDNGAIIFGETCAGDFFNIAPEDMKKLVKTRKIMSDEIEIASNIVTNKLEKEYIEKAYLLYSVIEKLQSQNTNKIINIFGKQIGYTLLAFIKVQLPFPRSLVLLAAKEARKDRKKFWTELFSDYTDILEKIYADDATEPLKNIRFVLDFALDYSIEGEYQYDPINDETKSRRDIGKYNEKTRQQRRYLNGKAYNTSLIEEKMKSNLNSYSLFISVVRQLYTVYIKAEKYIDNNLSELDEIKNRPSRFTSSLTSFIVYDDKCISDNELPNFSVLVNALNFSTKYNYGNTMTLNIQTYYTHRSARYKEPNLESLKTKVQNTIALLGGSEALIEATLGKYRKIKFEQKEKELKALKLKEAFYMATIAETNDLSKEYDKGVCIFRASGATKLSILEYKDLDMNVDIYKDNIVKLGDLRDIQEIPSYKYMVAMRAIDEALRQKEIERKEQERKQKEQEKEKKETTKSKATKQR